MTATGATPVEVIGSLHTPLGLLWHDGVLYVASKARVDAYSGLAGNEVHEAPHRAHTPGASRRSEQHRALVDRAAARRHLRALRPLHTRRRNTRARSSRSGPTAATSRCTRAASAPRSASRSTRARATCSSRWTTATTSAPRRRATRSPSCAAGTAWGNPACYGQGGTACTGVPATTASLDEHAAVGGVAIVTGQLGTTVGTSALVAEWALGKVQRVALDEVGDDVHRDGLAVPHRHQEPGRGHAHRRQRDPRRRLDDRHHLPDRGYRGRPSSARRTLRRSGRRSPGARPRPTA